MPKKNKVKFNICNVHYVKTIGKHISNAINEELDNSTVAKFATVQNEGGRDVERDIEHGEVSNEFFKAVM
jgi:hypothetical protein